MDLLTINNQILASKISTHEVFELRQRLVQLGAWPEAGDAYLSMIETALWDRGQIREQDFDWIPKVVEDVNRGIDIGCVYPSFFQKLITSHELRAEFIKQLH